MGLYSRATRRLSGRRSLGGRTRSQLDKVYSALDQFEQTALSLGDRVDIGTITIACALGYLDFRFPDLGWRASRPQLSSWFSEFENRPSMQATMPHG
jgi:glutathione S-transferase